MRYDAIIIGAGAAGTYCAIHAAGRGLRVLLLDHNPDLGAQTDRIIRLQHGRIQE